MKKTTMEMYIEAVCGTGPTKLTALQLEGWLNEAREAPKWWARDESKPGEVHFSEGFVQGLIMGALMPTHDGSLFGGLDFKRKYPKLDDEK